MADIEQPFPSTTWVWEHVRLSTGAAGRRAQSPQAAARKALERRDFRRPLPVVMHYRGGAQCWFELRARGCVYRMPGDVALLDVARWITRTRDV